MTKAGAQVEPREIEIQLYAKREEIYPRQRIGDSLGVFQKWRWATVWVTQIVFYGLPWLPWNGRQALLFDLAARKFYIFGMVLWPQDIIYLTAILIIAALSLFLFTAVGGRLWCGYACPQTVYTEIFMWIERHIEGDRAKRMRLDKEPMSGRKFAAESRQAQCVDRVVALDRLYLRRLLHPDPRTDRRGRHFHRRRLVGVLDPVLWFRDLRQRGLDA